MSNKNTLTLSSYNPLLDLLHSGNKDVDSRLSRFVGYLAFEGLAWHSPDLAAYRDTMLEAGFRSSTVAAHLSTIRSAYAKVLKDNGVRKAILDNTPPDLDVASRLALLNEVLAQLHNATDPRQSVVKQTTRQDEADSAHVRLSPSQAMALIDMPGTDDLKGLRDTAIIALMLCTGIREAELTGLVVDDLRQTIGGELALRVTEGKGKKQRLVPYGDLDWCLVLVDVWLNEADIHDGAVFRGFYKGQRPRPEPMTTRAVQLVLAEYTIPINGKMRAVRPHDLRRSYARLQYESGMQPLALQQNLGHTKQETTQHYIGVLDAKDRRARAAITYPLGRLRRQGKLLEVEETNS